jgi:hypothetical protein
MSLFRKKKIEESEKEKNIDLRITPKSNSRDTHSQKVIEDNSETDMKSANSGNKKEGLSNNVVLKSDNEDKQEKDDDPSFGWLSSAFVIIHYKFLNQIKKKYNSGDICFFNQLKIFNLLSTNINFEDNLVLDPDGLIINYLNTELRDLFQKFCKKLGFKDGKYNKLFNTVMVHIRSFMFEQDDDAKKNIFNNLIYAKIMEESIPVLDELFSALSQQNISTFEEEEYLDNKVYNLPDEILKKLIIISDLHGDRESLIGILTKEKFFEDDSKNIVFLGDYIDRGPFQQSVLLGIMLLKLLFPRRVFLLRGNHEYFSKNTDNKLIPMLHDEGDPDSLFVNFWQKHLTTKTMNRINKFFNTLPGVVIIKDIIFTHAGISRPEGSINNFNFDKINGREDLNDEDTLFQMAWSRPENKPNVFIMGTTGFSFASVHFDLFMKVIHCNIMFRGHCVQTDGYDTPSYYNDRLITIFSTGNNPESVDENSHYYFVNPCYATIENGNSIEIKRIFADEIVKKLSITEVINRKQLT